MIVTQDPNAYTDFYPTQSLILNDVYTRRFYMVMSDVFNDDNKYNAFVDRLLTNQVQGNSDLVNLIKQTCEGLKVIYRKEYEAEKKVFSDFEGSDTYKKYTSDKIDEFNTTLTYTTEKLSNTNDNEKLLKKTYSNVNVDNHKNTFNGKITFN